MQMREETFFTVDRVSSVGNRRIWKSVAAEKRCRTNRRKVGPVAHLKTLYYDKLSAETRRVYG